MSKSDWTDLTKEIFSELFNESPIKRAEFATLIRNINSWNKKNLIEH